MATKRAQPCQEVALPANGWRFLDRHEPALLTLGGPGCLSLRYRWFRTRPLERIERPSNPKPVVCCARRTPILLPLGWLDLEIEPTREVHAAFGLVAFGKAREPKLLDFDFSVRHRKGPFGRSEMARSPLQAVLEIGGVEIEAAKLSIAQANRAATLERAQQVLAADSLCHNVELPRGATREPLSQRHRGTRQRLQVYAVKPRLEMIMGLGHQAGIKGTLHPATIELSLRAAQPDGTARHLVFGAQMTHHERGNRDFVDAEPPLAAERPQRIIPHRGIGSCSSKGHHALEESRPRAWPEPSVEFRDAEPVR